MKKLLLFILVLFSLSASSQTTTDWLKLKSYLTLKNYKIDNITNDTVLSSNSVSKLPTEFAVRRYVQNYVASNVLPSQAGQSGKYLTTNGTTASWGALAVTTPGGASTQVQYNNAGTFGGLDSFTVFANPDRVGIGVPVPTARLDIQGSGSTSATNALRIRNSAGTDLFAVRNDGKANYTGASITSSTTNDAILGITGFTHTANTGTTNELWGLNIDGTQVFNTGNQTSGGLRIKLSSNATTAQYSRPLLIETNAATEAECTMSNTSNTHGMRLTLRRGTAQTDLITIQPPSSHPGGAEGSGITLKTSSLSWAIGLRASGMAFMSNTSSINPQSVDPTMFLINKRVKIGQFPGTTPLGTLEIKGEGNTSSTNSLYIHNSSNVAALTIRDDNQIQINSNTEASKSSLILSGTGFSGGSSTTTKPTLLIEPTGTTSTGWSTSGTKLGVNAESGFTGNLIDAQINGSSLFRVDNNGTSYASGDGFYTSTGNLYLLNPGGNASIIFSQGIIRSRGVEDGVISLFNASATGFNRLQFGGHTSSFPSLKRNGTGLDVRLADDSGYAPTQALYDRFGTGSPESVVTAPIGTIYHRTDGGTNTTIYRKESGVGNTGWVAASAASGGTPAGASTQVQYNNAGSFGALDSFTVSANPDRVGIGVPVPTARLDIQGSGSTSATNALRVRNSAGTNLMTVSNDGEITTSSSPISGYGMNINSAIRTGNTAVGLWGVAGISSLGTINSTDLRIATNNTQGIYINTSQQVGIGSLTTLLAGLHNSIATTASTPSMLLSGTGFSGGTATTTKPTLLIEPTGTTSTGWSTSGTKFGVNAETGFTGSLLDAQVNGTSKFSVSHTGEIRCGTIYGGIALFSNINNADNSKTVFSMANTTGNTNFGGGLFQFGGTTSSFPALKRTATGLDVRLADDSGYGILGTGTLNNFANTTASTPSMILSGTGFAGGSATTTKPTLLIEPAGTTSNNWSTSGTKLGINAESGFTGNFLVLQVNGVSRASISQNAQITLGTGTLATANQAIRLNSTVQGLTLNNLTITQRNAVSWDSGDAGTTLYNSSSKRMNLYDGTAWTQLGKINRVNVNSANNRLGLEVTGNAALDSLSVGYSYSSLPTLSGEVDTLDQIAIYDASSAINSKALWKDLVYNAFGSSKQAGNLTVSLTANVAADVKLASTGLCRMFSYNVSTGELTYNGTITKVFSFDATINVKYSVAAKDLSGYVMHKPMGGSYTEIAQATTHLATTSNINALTMTGLVQLQPGAKIKLQSKTDANGTLTVVNGGLKLTPLPDNYIAP